MNFKEDNIDNLFLGTTFDKFNKVYEETNKKYIRVLEKMRKKLIKIIILGWALFFIWSIFSIWINNSKVSIAVGAIVGVLFYFYYDKHESKYIDFYKREVISNFFKLLNDNLTYLRTRNEITEIIEEYKSSKFNKLLDAFEANDFVEGYIDKDVFVKMCGLHVSFGAGKHKHNLRINSVFSFAYLNKYLKTQIRISTKHKKEKNVLKIDNELFEKIYQVSSKNEEEASKILKEEIINYLIEFYNENNINFEIILKSNRLYIRFFRDGMFEPKIYTNSINKELLLKDFKMMSFVINLAQKLNKYMEK